MAGFNRAMPVSSAGQAAFVCLATGAYLLMAGQGILLTCDCVSLEKREGTLGLLFLTDLSGFDIIAGKMVAQVSRSLYCLLAALPALGFCILLGGVAVGDFVMVALGLLNTLFYFAALGLLISVCVWSEWTAMTWGGVALLVLGILLPMLCAMCSSAAYLVWVPVGALLAAPSFPSGLSPSSPTACLLIPHAMGWLFIGAASWLVPRSWTPATNVRPLRRITAMRQTWPPLCVPTPWLSEPAKPLFTTALLAIIFAVVPGAALLGPSWMTAPAAPICDSPFALCPEISGGIAIRADVGRYAAERRTGDPAHHAVR